MKAKIMILLLILVLALSACKPAAEAPAEEAPATGELQIPDIEEGKFNVALVMLSVHNDNGWSQAQYEGLQYLEANTEGVHTAYIESVAEGADAEQVFRALARKGFDLIIGGSFGYMDSMEVVASEFPDQKFIHISGYKANGTNFGNLFGAMEDMKYLAGMIAGARCVQDGKTKIGYLATFPIPEELRLGNAFALGMRRTCPDCTLDVVWINTWHDPVIERQAADSLFDAGAHIVFTGADTPASALAAHDREGVYGITYDWVGSCTLEECLTAPYWNWGPVFKRVVEEIQAGTYVFGWDYFDADSGGLGIFGLMEGQTMPPGMASLPPEVLDEIKGVLADMLAGEFTRFDVFAGPIYDNKGNLVVPEGEKMVQSDLDQFPPGAPGLECKYCMRWWAEGITAELPE